MSGIRFRQTPIQDPDLYHIYFTAYRIIILIKIVEQDWILMLLLQMKSSGTDLI